MSYYYFILGNIIFLVEPESNDGATNASGRAEELYDTHHQDVDEKHFEAVGFAVAFLHLAQEPRSFTSR